jgi:hypothetical protein
MVRSRRAQLPPSLTDAARSAPFVLVGTARHPRQSTVKELPGDREDTVVVRVEEVIDAPPGVQLAGRDVTIRLSGRSLRRGLRAVFFATSLIYGDQIALAEVARIEGPVDIPLVREQILDAKLEALDDALRERLRRANLVVLAAVQRVGSLQQQNAEPTDEDRANWRTADLAVYAVFKGRPPEQPRIVFPFPRTRRWPDAPIFVERQEGVWVLHSNRGKDPTKAGRRVPALPGTYTALDRLDFHAPASAPRIRVLVSEMKSTRPKS